MIEEKVVKTLRRLPATQQQEALNYVEYLAQKGGHPAPSEAKELPDAATPADYQSNETLNAFTAITRFLTLDSSQFSAAQRQAYEQACKTLKQGRSSGDPRILGLFTGLGQISDDFDAPLPDEDLFWGEASNANGFSEHS